MVLAARTSTFLNTLREAHKAAPGNYAKDTPAYKLITLSDSVNDLCRELAAVRKYTTPYNQAASADKIKHSATNIINIAYEATCAIIATNHTRS